MKYYSDIGHSNTKELYIYYDLVLFLVLLLYNIGTNRLITSKDSVYKKSKFQGLI